MKRLKHTARAVAASVLLAVMINGSAVATAFGAANTPGSSGFSLLSQAVRDAAQSEAQNPSDYTIMPETSPGISPETSTAEDAVPPAPQSLTALVGAHRADDVADAEEKCLAGAIYFEAKGESFEGQLAVAQVILNRVSSGRFAHSICGVILQSGQFSFVRGGAIPAVLNSKTWRDAVAIARIARAKLHPSSAANALYFHAARVSPNWKLSRVASIGNHIFYR